jgi:hypothetical protein
MTGQWNGNDIEGGGHDLYLRYYPGICLEELRKIINKNLSEVSQTLDHDMKSGPPEYEAGVLITRPPLSVTSQPSGQYHMAEMAKLSILNGKTSFV